MKKKADNMGYYDMTELLKTGATYHLLIGPRSNGKSYAVKQYILETFVHTGKQGAIVRRWDSDIRGVNGTGYWADMVDMVVKLTEGRWCDIYYINRQWFFCRYDETGKRETAEQPFCFAFALSMGEHYKGSQYPDVRVIFFDEFIARANTGGYLPDEFILWQNVVSTIRRQRDDIEIFMGGNTVSTDCPYFEEMGLTNILKQKIGTIDIYRYGDSDLIVAVEYCAPYVRSDGKRDKFFAFGNPKLKMITDGVFELDIYPHLIYEYKPKDVIFQYFIKWGGEIYHAEIIANSETTFTYIHRKTTPIKDEEHDIVFQTEYDYRPNFYRSIFCADNNLTKRIKWYFDTDRVYYHDNVVGDHIANYLNWCKQN